MQGVFSLCDLEPGMKATVMHVDALPGMRRRFFDIGLVKDTVVECVGKSPLGDPKAYMIRGAVIAIRNEDSIGISVTKLEEQ